MKRYSNALLLPTAEAYQSRSKLLNTGTVLATSTKLQDKSALQQLKARIDWPQACFHGYNPATSPL
jgi:hypothetical protein